LVAELCVTPATLALLTSRLKQEGPATRHQSAVVQSYKLSCSGWLLFSSQLWYVQSPYLLPRACQLTAAQGRFCGQVLGKVAKGSEQSKQLLQLQSNLAAVLKGVCTATLGVFATGTAPLFHQSNCNKVRNHRFLLQMAAACMTAK
jgi:hypothetical protein